MTSRADFYARKMSNQGEAMPDNHTMPKTFASSPKPQGYVVHEAMSPDGVPEFAFYVGDDQRVYYTGHNQNPLHIRTARTTIIRYVYWSAGDTNTIWEIGVEDPVLGRGVCIYNTVAGSWYFAPNAGPSTDPKVAELLDAVADRLRIRNIGSV